MSSLGIGLGGRLSCCYTIARRTPCRPLAVSSGASSSGNAVPVDGKSGAVVSGTKARGRRLIKVREEKRRREYDRLHNYPDWAKILEDASRQDEELRAVLGDSIGNPELMRKRIRERVRKKGRNFNKAKTGSMVAFKVSFRNFNPLDSFIWFQLYGSPTDRDVDLLGNTLDVCNLSGESAKCLLQLKDLTVRRVLFADIMKVSSLAGLIRSSPNIERLAIFMEENDDTAEVLEPKEYYFCCNNLQTVELYFLNSSNAAMAFIKSLLLKSPQLQEMSVWRVEVSSLIGLIRCSPGLKRLKIWVDDYAARINHDEEYDFSSNRLQIVELCSFCGTNAEMMFVKALLLKSPQLKEMTIRDVNQENELQILREIIGFRRASVDVAIKLLCSGCSYII